MAEATDVGHRRRGTHLVRTAIALIASAVGSGLLGLLYWLVAARLYPPRNVGLASGEISAMALISSVCQLNWTTVYPRFAQQSGRAAMRLLTFGYVVTGTLSLLAATLFVVLRLAKGVVPDGTGQAALFVVSVPLWTIFALQDAALTGLRAAIWVPVENIAFGAVKIGLLAVFVGSVLGGGVFVAWVLPTAVTVLAVNAYLYLRLLPRHAAASSQPAVLPSRADLMVFIGGEYLGSLAQTAMLGGPILIVLLVLGAAQNAYFSIPWLVGNSLGLVLLGIATPLLVESTADPTRVFAHVRGAVRLGTAVFVAGCLAVIVLAPVVVPLYGSRYAHDGRAVLQLVAASVPFAAVNLLYVTLARMDRRVRRSVVCQVAVALLVNGASVLLVGRHGIVGAGIALVVGQGAVAVVVLPSVVKQYRALRAASVAALPDETAGQWA